MPYRIAGIDVHKRMLAVVVADVAVEGEYQLRTADDRARVLTNCARWPNGSSSATSTKW